MISLKTKLLFLLLLFSLVFTRQTSSASLGVTKNSLQSARLSFAGRVAAPTVVGATHVWIDTTSAVGFYSTSTDGLNLDDVITIGTGSYTVASIIDADEFTTTTTLAAGDADPGDVIYYNAKPQQVITFTTATAIPGGFFRVLVPAATTNSNNGIPDSTGFDFNTTVTTAGTNATNYIFLSTAATASGGTSCPSGWHCFEYHYTGTGAVGRAITLSIGTTTGASTPIAPSPKSSHVSATADVYSVRVQNFANGSDPNSNPTDQTRTKIGVIESVRISATVDPSITFSIAGVTSGANPCGTGTANQTDIDTTTGVNAPLAVPFGTLAFNTFKDAAHLFTLSTNAANGYTVTAQENDQLGRDGGTSPFIPDVSGDNTLANETTSDTWDTATAHPGFGYTLASINLATVPFGSTGANFNARRFPSLADPDAPTVQTVMSSTGTSDAHTANVCYRIAVDTSQAGGNYENQVTYTATASF